MVFLILQRFFARVFSKKAFVYCYEGIPASLLPVVVKFFVRVIFSIVHLLNISSNAVAPITVPSGIADKSTW